MATTVSELAKAIYIGIKPYLIQNHDPVDVTMKIFVVLQEEQRDYSSWMTTAPKEVVLPKEDEPSIQTQASNPADTTVASEGGAAIVIASDDPVKDMPDTPKGRAQVRLGRDKSGKSRP